MTHRKLLLSAVALGVMAGMAWADPVRTTFVRENQFPEALGWEFSLDAGGYTYDDDFGDDVDVFDVGPSVRFGVTDWLAARAHVPFRTVSLEDTTKRGLGDISLGADFRFFEDIFGYAWIVPHATVFLPTGDEDKYLGKGKTSARVGISVGHTVNDVVHFGADVSYVANGKVDEDDPDGWEGMVEGSLSLIWDLDERASLLGEIQANNGPVDPDDDYALRGHVGLVFKVTSRWTLMGYGGTSSRMNQDFYGAGRLVYHF